MKRAVGHGSESGDQEPSGGWGVQLSAFGRGLEEQGATAAFLLPGHGQPE